MCSGVQPILTESVVSPIEQSGKYFIMDTEQLICNPFQDVHGGTPSDVQKRTSNSEKQTNIRNNICENQLSTACGAIERTQKSLLKNLHEESSALRYEMKVLDVERRKTDLETKRRYEPDKDYSYDNLQLSNSEKRLGVITNSYYLEKHQSFPVRQGGLMANASFKLREARRTLLEKRMQANTPAFTESRTSLTRENDREDSAVSTSCINISSANSLRRLSRSEGNISTILQDAKETQQVEPLMPGDANVQERLNQRSPVIAFADMTHKLAGVPEQSDTETWLQKSSPHTRLPQSDTETRLPQHGLETRLPQHGLETRLPQDGSETRLPHHGPETRLQQRSPDTRISQSDTETRLPQHGPETRLPQHGPEPRLSKHGPETRLPQLLPEQNRTHSARKKGENQVPHHVTFNVSRKSAKGEKLNKFAKLDKYILSRSKTLNVASVTGANCETLDDDYELPPHRVDLRAVLFGRCGGNSARSSRPSTRTSTIIRQRSQIVTPRLTQKLMTQETKEIEEKMSKFFENLNKQPGDGDDSDDEEKFFQGSSKAQEIYRKFAFAHDPPPVDTEPEPEKQHPVQQAVDEVRVTRVAREWHIPNLRTSKVRQLNIEQLVLERILGVEFAGEENKSAKIPTNSASRALRHTTTFKMRKVITDLIASRSKYEQFAVDTIKSKIEMGEDVANMTVPLSMPTTDTDRNTGIVDNSMSAS